MEYKKYVLILGYLLLFLFTSLQAQTDSLWRVWNNRSLHDTLRLSAIDDLVWFNYLESNPDSAAYWIQIEYDLAKKANSLTFMSSSLNMMARVYHTKGNLYKSRQYLLENLKVRQQQNNLKGIAKVYSNLAVSYNQEDDYPRALKYCFMALKLSERVGDQATVAAHLDDIANLYSQQENYEKAFVYLDKSLKMKRELGDSLPLAYTYKLLGSTYRRTKNLPEAERYMHLALSIYQHHATDSSQLANCYNMLSALSSAHGKHALAIDYQERSLRISRSQKNFINEAEALSNLESVYESAGEPDKAIHYGQLAMKIIERENMLYLKQAVGIRLSNLFEDKKEFKKALYYFKMYASAKDSIKIEEGKKSAANEQLKYDFEKQQTALKAAHDQDVIKLQSEAALEKARKNTWVLVLIFILVALTGILVFGMYFYKQRNIISEQRNNILKQKLLVSQMNPHFIFNTLTSIQKYVLKNDGLQAGSYLSKFAHLIRMILEFSRKDFISVESEVKMLTAYVELQQMRLQHKFTFSIQVDKRIQPEAVFIPPMLAQPFVENAIEHGLFHKNGSGHISISLLFEGTRLIYTVEDDGVGIEAAQKIRRELDIPYASLATTITRERNEAFHAKNKADARIEILDKKAKGFETSGVRVRFAIPFKES